MKYLVLALFALALAAPAARANGFNLTWGTGCWRDNPATLATSACDSNDGSVSFTVSFYNQFPIQQFIGVEAWLDLQSDSPTLPDWWQLTDPGGCRQGALSVSFEPATPSGCANPWQGRVESQKFVNWSTAAFPFYGGEAANRAKLYVLYAPTPYNPLPSGVEYFAFTVTINMAKTVGTGACGGCSTPVTIVLNEVLLAGGRRLKTPLDNQCLRWQAGGVTPCSATPTRSTTWGQIKSLYR
ncbi:MAG: hypothetical protein A2W00_03235 [Candidatus Eisenbacteria bacterium RBG_16_71_46]|nr:MAG: hypothetical protein A2Z48_11265 [Actinobacteria bacterium RBG_19FT_COMBO_70_19]OGF05577.1 MAG: hypothetical protein A2W00_03235 [Candidatus Eisenbacteria bacterium RBG_16_71_46]